MLLFVQMVFGQTASYGGSRVTGVADARAIKVGQIEIAFKPTQQCLVWVNSSDLLLVLQNLIEAAKASVVAPYTYDLSMTSMNEIEHSEELEESMVEFILEFLLTSEACSVLGT